ncbi:Protein phosphatase Slingshot homolog 2 [Geodia barretti]|uniref:protein-serine/threonine phosphatase n=1 Tax=Geodia barretti TaxID=519541 RepID=A0AA35SBL2_GEOBA|nr:Protein phosphatase Slingshot homolog 2 [Geodia barretti]
MWTTLQSLYQSTENARVNNYYVGGLSHTWMSFYLAQLTDDCLIRNEWNLLKDVESFRPDSLIYSSNISSTKAGNVFEKQLVSKLRGVMLHEDLEEVTSRQLREKLEKEMDMGLTEYREFLDRHMLRILDSSNSHPRSWITSTWAHSTEHDPLPGFRVDASNLSELEAFGVGYILNVTREIDNFYPEVFKYLNIRLYDVPDSELIKHWEKTYRFIKEAK